MWAQNENVPAPTSSEAPVVQSGSLTEPQLLERRAVDDLTRIILTRLRTTPAPARGDFEAAARAIDLVRKLDPTDTNLLRRSIEAWSASGDPETELERIRALLELDPGDIYAQLRVTLAGLSQLQSADIRLRAYENILGDRGRALDPSVRSRLAVDAALLARDFGDDRKFLEYLTLATTLDATNKEAAALYAGNLLQLTTDPEERVDILCNVVLADPLDPSAYENLGLELLQYGAFAGALRAFQLSSIINNNLGGQLTEDRIFDFALCEWNVQGPGVALTRLRKVLDDTIRAENARRQEILDDGRDPGEEKDMFLPPRLQLLRLAIAASDVSEENTKALAAILEDYSKGNEQVIGAWETQLAEADSDERKLAIETRIQEYRLQRLWAQLAAGDELDQAEAFINELDQQRKDADENGADPTKAPPLPPEVLQRYRGWLLVMQHLDLDGEKLLAPLVENDNIARWAMGLLKEGQGLTDEAMKHYAILARDQPTTALGSTAFFRLKRLVGKPIIRSATAEALDRRVLSFAPWLDGLASDPSRFMSARILVSPEEARILDRPVITIEIRNTARWPLGVGAGRPIPKRMLLAPRVRRDGREITENITPFVALIESRLRLEPSSTVSVTVNPLREDLGRVFDNGASSRFDARWQLLQNFISDRGTFKASPLTITAQSEVLTRVPVEATISPDALADRIRSGEGAQLISDVLLAGSMIIQRSSKQSMANPQTAQERTLLASAMIDRIPEVSEVQRTLVLIRCVELGMLADPELRESLIAAVADETAQLPLLATVIGLAWAPDSPVFDHAEHAGDPEVARIATLLRESLQLSAENAAAAANENDAPDGGASPAPSAPSTATPN